MVSLTTRMPSGFAGRITRHDGITVEQNVINAASPPTAYGTFVKLVAGQVQPVTTGDTAANVYGVLVSPFPASGASGLGAVAPQTFGICDVLLRGYIAVSLGFGTAVKGAPVYLRTVASGAKLVGAIEAVADGTNNFVVAGAFFEGPADATGVVEIRVNI